MFGVSGAFVPGANVLGIVCEITYGLLVKWQVCFHSVSKEGTVGVYVVFCKYQCLCEGC